MQLPVPYQKLSAPDDPQSQRLYLDEELGRIAATLSGLTSLFTREGNFVVNGSWDSGHLLLGVYHIWVDATGAARIKATAPASDTDGVTIGSQ
jgi:hypothetical protein